MSALKASIVLCLFALPALVSCADKLKIEKLDWIGSPDSKPDNKIYALPEGAIAVFQIPVITARQLKSAKIIKFPFNDAFGRYASDQRGTSYYANPNRELTYANMTAHRNGSVTGDIRDRYGHRHAIVRNATNQFWIAYAGYEGEKSTQEIFEDKCGTIEGVLCQIPFTYNNITYNGCTEIDSEGEPWCSIRTDARGKHEFGQWGYCLMDECPSSAASVAAAAVLVAVAAVVNTVA